MFETINESIAVIGVYTKSFFTPHKFKWQEQEYKVTNITLVSNIRDGGIKKRLYSVAVNDNIYRICFNRDSEDWVLEEVYYGQ